MIRQFVKLVKRILCPCCAHSWGFTSRLWRNVSPSAAGQWAVAAEDKHKPHSTAPAGTVAFTEDRLVYSKVLLTSAGQAERSHISNRRGPEVLGLFLQELNLAADEKFWAIDFYLGCLKRQLGCNEQPQFSLVLTAALSALPKENCHQSVCSWVKN